MSIERIPPTQGSNGPSSSQEKQDPSKVMQDKVKEFYAKLKEEDEEPDPDDVDPE